MKISRIESDLGNNTKNHRLDFFDGYGPTQIATGFAIAILGGILLIFFRGDNTPFTVALLAVTIFWIGLIPSVMYLKKLRIERPAFPLMPLTGLFYGLFFGASTLFVDRLRSAETGKIHFYGLPPFENISVEAELLVLFGLALLLLFWSLSKRIVWRRVPKFRLPDAFAPVRLKLLLWVLVIGHVVYIYVPALQALPSIGQIVQPVGYLSFAMFFLIWRSGDLSRLQAAIIFFVLLPMAILSIVISASIAKLILALVLFAALLIRSRVQIPWSLVVAIPILVGLLYPVTQAIRGTFWQETANLSYYEKLRKLPEITARKINNGEVNTIGFIQRSAMILIFTRVVQTTPNPVSYWNGQTYRPMISSWIPRAFWPGKPEERAGNTFGRRYGFISQDNKSMSLNLPWIVELYANFGRPGVLIGMSLIGILFGFLDRFLARSKISDLEFVTGATILLPLFFQDSNFTLMTGSLLPLVISLWVYFTFGLRAGFKN